MNIAKMLINKYELLYKNCRLIIKELLEHNPDVKLSQKLVDLVLVNIEIEGDPRIEQTIVEGSTQTK